MSEIFTESFESVVKRIKLGGYRVNNCLHRMDGMWQANLRRGNTHFFVWGYGVTAGEALDKALTKALEGKFATGSPIHPDDLDPCVTGNTRDAVQPIPADDVDEVQIDLEESIAAAPAEDEDDLIG